MFKSNLDHETDWIIMTFLRRHQAEKLWREMDSDHLSNGRRDFIDASETNFKTDVIYCMIISIQNQLVCVT